MGLISFFLGKKPTIIEDSFFGRMHLMEHRKDASLSYFECYRHFEPLDGPIEICLYGNIGPTQKQIAFFKKIENQYNTIEDAVATAITKEMRNWDPDFRIINFRNEFKPSFLVIPHCNEEPMSWEISFFSTSDPHHVFNARLRNFELEGIDMDG